MHGDERGFEERDALDQRIDAALRRYAEAPRFSEPRVALARVRTRAEQEPEQRSPWRVWLWAAPAAVAALIAIVVLVLLVRVPHAPQVAWTPKAPGVATVEHSTPTDLQGGEKGNAGPSARDANRCCAKEHGAAIRTLAQDDSTVAARSLPKQEVFPTPQPLSPEEQRLAAFVSQAPPAVKEQVLAARQSDESIELADIQIKPLGESRAEPQTKGKELP